jgi:hypothetical protein
MRRFETTYSIRTPMRTCGSSKGIFFDTCIIPRMMTRLVICGLSPMVAGYTRVKDVGLLWTGRIMKCSKEEFAQSVQILIRKCPLLENFSERINAKAR